MSSQDWPQSIPLAAILSNANEPVPAGDSLTLLLFEAGPSLYALDARAVELIVTHRLAAPVPFGPPELLGIAAVMGRMRLVIDFPTRDRVTGEDRRKGPWRLVVLHGDAQVAVVADHVFGVLTVAPDEITPVEHPNASGRLAHGAREALLLDPDRLIQWQ